MYISEETSWVCLDLLDVEGGTSIGGGAGDIQTSAEWTLKTAN